MSLNTIPANPSQIPAILDLCHEEQLSVILWGSTGIGKTEIVKQWVKALPQKDKFRGREPKLWGAHLSTIEATDVKGMIVPDMAAKKSIYLPPEFLPPENDEGVGALFWDEINRGEGRLQNAVFQCLQERRVGNFRIPDGYLIICAANNVEFSESVYSMDPALADRLVHVQVVATAESFITWGMLQSDENPKFTNIDPRVLAFIRTASQYIDGCEERVKNGKIIGWSPRGWHRVSRVLRRNPDKQTLMFMINGIVGNEAAAEFFTVLEELESNVEVEKIMKAQGRELLKVLPRSKVGLYRLAYALIGAVEDGETGVRALQVINAWRELEKEHGNELPIRELQTLAAENIFEKAGKKKVLEKIASSKAYDEYIAHRPKHEAA